MRGENRMKCTRSNHSHQWANLLWSWYTQVHRITPQIKSTEVVPRSLVGEEVEISILMKDQEPTLLITRLMTEPPYKVNWVL